MNQEKRSLSYEERFDKRGFDETRPIVAKAGVIPRADGSGYFKIGYTEAYASVYGPRELYPSFLKNPKTGILRCRYEMLPWSGSGDRIRPGPSRRSKEIALVTEQALKQVLLLEEFPNTVVDLFIEFPQTDAGTRCAGICAAAIALADAGIPMKDMVAAVSVGKVGDRLVVDLSYDEEAFEGGAVDIPVAMIHRSKEISLLQMDGDIKKEELKKALEMAQKALDKINQEQVKALKEKYKKEK